MTTERFLASAQYNDYKGTSAADRADDNGASAWLEANGHKQPDEFLLGITMFAGENHGTHKDPVFVEFLLASPGNHDTVKNMIDSSQGPVDVRSVKVDMPLSEFFGLFKRFSVTLSSHGMLGEREYRHDD